MAINYSWGQIRLLLQQFAGPGVSLDTIDHAIRARYELILTTMEWAGIEQTGIIQTVAGYRAGAIVTTLGSAAVMGIGTNWTGDLSGRQLFVGPGKTYDVTILSPTSLTLDRPFEGQSGGPYCIAQAYYNLPGNCRSINQIFSPVDGGELLPIDQDVFGELDGSFLPIDGAEGHRGAANYVPWTDGTNQQTGEIVQRILLLPVPIRSEGYKFTYDSVAVSFDGLSTTDGPLPFVSAAALIAGAKADIEMAKPKPSPIVAAANEAAFQKWLTGMIHVENAKHPNQRMRLDESYTRHRMRRFLRSGGPVIARNLLMQTTGDSLQSGAGTYNADTFTGTGTRALFPLSQVPLTAVVVLVNNTLATAGTYVQAGKVLNFLAGNIPAAGAAITVIYTF